MKNGMDLQKKKTHAQDARVAPAYVKDLNLDPAPNVRSARVNALKSLVRTAEGLIVSARKRPKPRLS